jgi:hypothetical protein
MQLYLCDLYLGTCYLYYMFWPRWAIFRYYVYKKVKWTVACNQSSYHFYTCSKDNTCLNKGHTDIVAYKGVFIYLLRSSATGHQSRITFLYYKVK